ncbi:hypothetical protein ABE504_06010 [Paenibacillus oryzisoli]|uniref:hypothetical protein n=1 Tax=Paenibacillus oryzisoli TaxID=1850517 RepID=UPI003D2CF28C
MRVWWKEERGAALLLVLFIIVVFTMIGMAVVSASLGGAIRTETKQKDVQSVHLAEKALNEAVARVQGLLDGMPTINMDQLSDELKVLMGQINGSDEVGSEYDAQYGKDQYGKDQSEVRTTAVLDTDHPPPKITITAHATIQGVERDLQQVIEINYYPDVLKYAAGSEDGNLIINGAPYFTGGNGGNLYAGKQLLIKNEAEYFYNNSLDDDDPKKSYTKYFPLLKGIAYVQSLKNIQYCDAQPTCNSYSQHVQGVDDDDDAKNVKEILGDTSEAQIKSSKDFIGVKMDESFVDKLTEAVHGGSDEWRTIDEILKDKDKSKAKSQLVEYLVASGMMVQTSPVKPSPEDLDAMTDYETNMQAFKQYVNGLNQLGKAETGSILFRGDFTLSSTDFTKLTFSGAGKDVHDEILDPDKRGYFATNWFIVDGDLNIVNTSDTPIEVRANLLVTGNVNIRGFVKMDATIFTMGETTIEDASIQGLRRDKDGDGIEDSDEDPRELVLMSKGKILITRINTNPDGTFKPVQAGFQESSNSSGDIQVLDAFFYTDDVADLYGVGSIFWIRGGFFSKKNMTINAIRGTAEVRDEMIDGEWESDGSRSRFIISYNSEIINHQASALPRITKAQLTRGKRIMVK